MSVIDGEVEIRLAEYFERPLRLSPAEGLALLAAGTRAAVGAGRPTPTGPLATALDKLEHALGAKGRLAVDVGRPDRSSGCATQCTTTSSVEIDYYSFARDEMTTRVVDPWRVFHAFGAWYLAAWCHRATAERLFRVDRVRALPRHRASTSIRRRGTPVSTSRAATSCTDHAPTTRASRCALAPEADWVVESYPHESATRAGDGSVDVVLAVSEPAWLERLLLASARDATVVAPAGRHVTTASRAAARGCSARYEH